MPLVIFQSVSEYTNTTELIVPLAGIFLALLLTVGGLSLVLSFSNHRREQRLKSKKEEIRRTLSVKVRDRNHDWEAWIDSLSNVERELLVEELDRRLLLKDYFDSETVVELVRTLGLNDQYNQKRGRFQSLMRLTRLDLPVDFEHLIENAMVNPRERALVARVLLERDYDEAGDVGTELLLFGKPLSVFGLDTLYRLNQSDPSKLLQEAQAHRHKWKPALLAQVFQVLTRCQPPSDSSLDWITTCLDHDSPAVRSAAAQVLMKHGTEEQAEGVITHQLHQSSQLSGSTVFRYHLHSLFLERLQYRSSTSQKSS